MSDVFRRLEAAHQTKLQQQNLAADSATAVIVVAVAYALYKKEKLAWIDAQKNAQPKPAQALQTQTPPTQRTSKKTSVEAFMNTISDAKINAYLAQSDELLKISNEDAYSRQLEENRPNLYCEFLAESEGKITKTITDARDHTTKEIRRKSVGGFLIDSAISAAGSVLVLLVGIALVFCTNWSSMTYAEKMAKVKSIHDSVQSIGDAQTTKQ